MRIIKDPAAVTQILRDRSWQMAGPVKRMLEPLLGEGVILATGNQHTQLRKQIGKLPRIDLDAILDAWTPPSHAVDLGEQMSLLAEAVIGALFNTSLAGVAPLVRYCVARPWLRSLNARLANLPPWTGDATSAMTAKQRRDWAAPFVVAGIDTMTSDLTAALVGVKLLPIYWLTQRRDG